MSINNTEIRNSFKNIILDKRLNKSEMFINTDKKMIIKGKNINFIDNFLKLEEKEKNNEKYKQKLIILNHKDKLVSDNMEKKRLFFEQQQKKSLKQIRELSMELDLLKDDIKKKEDEILTIDKKFDFTSKRLQFLNNNINECNIKIKDLENKFEFENIDCEKKKKENDLFVDENDELNEKIKILKTNIFEKKKKIKKNKLENRKNKELKETLLISINRLEKKRNFINNKFDNLKELKKEKDNENYEISKSLKGIKNRLEQENLNNLQNKTKFMNLNKELNDVNDEILKEEQNQYLKLDIIKNLKDEEKLKNEKIFQLEKDLKEKDFLLEKKNQKLENLDKIQNELIYFLKDSIKKFENLNYVDELKKMVKEQNSFIEIESRDLIKNINDKKNFLNNL